MTEKMRLNLKLDVQKVYISIKSRYRQTFGHIVYFEAAFVGDKFHVTASPMSASDTPRGAVKDVTMT